MIRGASFADCEHSFEDADYVIMGIPFDRTTSFRAGCRDAPDSVRRSSYNLEMYMFEHDHDIGDLKVHDMGDLDEYAQVDEMVEAAWIEASRIVDAGKFPITIGGEHSVTVPIVKAFSKDISVISVDAHTDFRDEYMGMKNSHACVMRRCADHVGKDNVASLGVRSISKEEVDAGLPFHVDSFTILEKGMEWAAERALDHLKNEKVYLTVDIDGIDPAYAPGTGTPEPFGLLPLHVKKLINIIGERLVGFDVVEVSPPYDNGNTSVLAARLIREAMAVSSKKR